VVLNRYDSGPDAAAVVAHVAAQYVLALVAHALAQRARVPESHLGVVSRVFLGLFLVLFLYILVLLLRVRGLCWLKREEIVAWHGPAPVASAQGLVGEAGLAGLMSWPVDEEVEALEVAGARGEGGSGQLTKEVREWAVGFQERTTLAGKPVSSVLIFCPQ
jgi:hypothetical protein